MTLVPHFFPFVVPLLVLTAYWSGASWAFRSVTWFFLCVLVLEFVAGKDSRERDAAGVHSAERYVLRLITWIWVPIHAALITTGLLAVGDASSNLPAIGIALGTVGGMFGIPVAHELMHRSNRFERALAEIQMTMFSYAHFCIEHVEGHHTNVGTPRDPATARLGESVYQFLPRSVCGGFAHAWRLESARLRRQNRSVIGGSNRMLRYLLTTFALYFAIGRLFGTKGLLLFAVQSVVSIGIIEIINYVEHYGLTRCELQPGRYEKVTTEHSWNSNHRVSNWLLFNVPRHADHHYEPNRAYPFVRHIESAPQLPAGSLAMHILALFPPLWRRIMDPLVRCST